MNRFCRLAGTLLVALALIAPTPQTGAAPAIEEVADGIVRLLDDYGRAFGTHDRGLLERTLSRGAFADAELRALADAADVPFRRFDVRPTTQFSGDLASPRIRRRYPDLDVATYHVLVETAFDVEETADLADGAFTFVREAPQPSDPYDGWRFASNADMEMLGFYSPRFLWNESKVAAVRSEHFLLLTHPDVAAEMRPVLGVAERAYAKATGFWPLPTDDRYAIIVPTTTAELDRLIRPTVDLSKFVAFVGAGVDREEGWEPAAPRLYVHLDHLRNYNADAQVEIFAHELVHAVTRPVSGPHIPVWVEEGIANVGGGTGGRPSRAREGPAPDEFPTNELFVIGPVRDIQRRYDQAQVAIAELIEEKGRDGMARFYSELGAARVAAGTETYHVERAVTESLGWTVDEWVAAWRKRLG